MKRGFTLLELLISCALLLVILGILGTTVNRAHQIRQEATRRTTLLTQGRAVLDFIANDLQSIIATNLEIQTSDFKSYSATNNAIRFIRSVHLADAEPGSATNALPAESVRYFVATNDYPSLPGYALYRQTVAWSNFAAAESGVVGQRAAIDNLGTRTRTVTNIVADSGQTLLPPAQQGDTVWLPVNTVSTDHIYDWNTSTGYRLVVTPGDGTNSHRVITTVTQTNSFIRFSLQTNAPPVMTAGFWPDIPRTTIATGYQAVTLLSTTNLWQGSMLFTNTPPVHTTNQSAIALLPTGGATQAMERVTFANVTNSWQVTLWTNDIAVLTNSFVGVGLEFTHFPATVVSNAWVRPGSTNDGVRVDHDAIDLAQWDTTPTPIPALGNHHWRVHAITNNHKFPPAGTQTPKELADLPLALESTQIFWFAQHPEAWETFADNTTRVMAQNTLTPLLTQNYWRVSETISTNAVTPANHIQTVWQRVTQVTVSVIETQVPAGTMSTGVHEFVTSATRDWVDTLSNEETHWVSYTLIEDFAGAPVDVFTLWLDEEKRTGSTFKYDFSTIEGLVGKRGDDGEPEMTEQQMLLDGIAACYFQPLCFRTYESGISLLEIWDPKDAEPPVCIDIYLELIDPAIGRRAAMIEDQDQRAAFVRRHVVRLTKRVPLQTHNRWRAP